MDKFWVVVSWSPPVDAPAEWGVVDVVQCAGLEVARLCRDDALQSGRASVEICDDEGTIIYSAEGSGYCGCKCAEVLQQGRWRWRGEAFGHLPSADQRWERIGDPAPGLLVWGIGGAPYDVQPTPVSVRMRRDRVARMVRDGSWGAPSP